MKYTIESTLEDFSAWSGGKDTLETLIEKGDCDAVEDFITECLTDPTATDINDFLWFERDQIAWQLGYGDWDEYERGESLDVDCNGVVLAVSDEVKWHDEAGVEEDGTELVFTIVEDRGDGYYNIALDGEDNPERWAWHEELEIV